MLPKHRLIGLYKFTLMMSDQEITQEEFEQLVDDASYLQDEAEALKYVIDQVPYEEAPPDGMSIFNRLKLIDHAQTEYYRPIIERVFSENRLINLSDFKSFEESFTRYSDEEEKDIQKTLNKIIKHRAGLINVFRKISLINWERGVKDTNGTVISLYSFAKKLIQSERKILKEIADLVLIYQNEKLKQKEIDTKIEQRKSS